MIDMLTLAIAAMAATTAVIQLGVAVCVIDLELTLRKVEKIIKEQKEDRDLWDRFLNSYDDVFGDEEMNNN